MLTGPSPMEANLYGDRVIEMDEDMMNTIADAYAQAGYGQNLQAAIW